MAAPEAQSPNDGNMPVLAGDTLPVGRSVLTEHDWVTYAMSFAAVLIIVGAPLVLLGSAWGHSTMLLIGAVCYAIAGVAWMGLFGFFTWKVVETGRIAVPILWRRIWR